MNRHRRRFLAAVGSSLVGLSGCQGNDGSGQTETTPATDTPTTRTPTTTQGEPTYPVSEIPEAGSLNLVPKTPDAPGADAHIFEQYNGDIDVEIDLEAAYAARHFDTFFMNQVAEEGMDPIGVKHLVDNITDSDWREEVKQPYIDAIGPDEYTETELDWELFADTSKDFKTRVVESGLMKFWVVYEQNFVGDPGISSAHNDSKAAAFQALDRKVGGNAIIWPFTVEWIFGGHHGTVNVLDNPQGKGGDTSEQQVYIMETDPRRTPIATTADSLYLRPDDSEDISRHNLSKASEHAAEENFECIVFSGNGDYETIETKPPDACAVEEQRQEAALYKMIGVSFVGHSIANYDRVRVSDALVDRFEAFYRQPKTDYGKDLIDKIMVSYYIVQHYNYGSDNAYVYLNDDEMTLALRPSSS